MVTAVSVRDVMTTDFLGVTRGEPVSDVADLLRQHDEDAVIVMHGGRPLGLVFARDLLAVIADGDENDPVETYMRGSPETVDPDATIGHAADRLSTAVADRLIVVDTDGLATGLVGPTDVLNVADTLLEEHLEGTHATSGNRSPPSISEQGVCEACGRLADTLVEVDGSLLCEACTDV